MGIDPAHDGIGYQRSQASTVSQLIARCLDKSIPILPARSSFHTWAHGERF